MRSFIELKDGFAVPVDAITSIELSESCITVAFNSDEPRYVEDYFMVADARKAYTQLLELLQCLKLHS